MRNQTTALLLGSLVCGMVGLSFAAVPLYDIFCRVTGYGGTTQVSNQAAPGATSSDRKIVIRFDASINQELDWKFKPAVHSQTVKVGESSLAFYEAANLAGEDTWGTASFNVTPAIAGSYFIKTDCFCFEQQKLAAGQSVDMPVAFYIDPEIEDDPYLNDVDTITLSYTFYPIEEEDWPSDDEVAQLTKTRASDPN